MAQKKAAKKTATKTAAKPKRARAPRVPGLVERTGKVIRFENIQAMPSHDQFRADFEGLTGLEIDMPAKVATATFKTDAQARKAFGNIFCEGAGGVDAFMGNDTSYNDGDAMGELAEKVANSDL